uniref:Uncharacterized protein n=1 Tax=Anguilla anguilla TaxID=7936 RepID=A0A0E9TLJ5_ANGAN
MACVTAVCAIEVCENGGVR